MNWLDRIIAGIAPVHGMRRAQARHAMRAYYEAAKPSRMRKFRTDRRSPDETVRNASAAIRVQARHLEQNYDVARGALDILVANTVGTGIRPEPQVMTTNGELAADVNAELLDLWRDWIRTPEVTRDFDYYGAQRIMARSLYRDGEAFSQILAGTSRSLDHGTRVPLSLELMEADMVPNDFDDDAKGIVQGVQKNAWGQPRNYYVFKQHPGGNLANIGRDYKRIPAERMIHVKLVDRIRQTRGVSIFASVLNRMDDIKDIDESERMAARISAAMCAAIVKGSPDLYGATPADPDATQSVFREMEMAPGMIFDDLQPGESIASIQSNRPNNALIPFRDAQLRSAAAGLGTSFSSLAKNYNGTYSAQRQELVEQYMTYGILSGYFANRFAHPVWVAFIDMVNTAGLVRFGSNVDMATIYDADHSRPVMPWVDPAREMNGIKMELELGLTSKSAVIRRRGGNPDEVRRQVEKERKESPPPAGDE